MQTTFKFTLPHGYIDDEGNVHQVGVMRLSRAIDEIVPLRDPRVQANPAYATVIILARVIERLGTLTEVSPSMVENFFAGDLSYLQDVYRYINKLEEKTQSSQGPQVPQTAQGPQATQSAQIPQATQSAQVPQAAQATQAPQTTPASDQGPSNAPSSPAPSSTANSTFSPPQSFVPKTEHPDSLAKAIEMTIGGKRR